MARPIVLRKNSQSDTILKFSLYKPNVSNRLLLIKADWCLTGTTGTYSNILAQGGSGSNAYFDVTVVDDLVDEATLDAPFGSGYSVGDVLTLPGSSFGGTEDITITIDSIYSDDVIITVSSVSQPPSVYEEYTCNIFKNSALSNRLSYYDASDVLTIKNINE